MTARVWVVCIQHDWEGDDINSVHASKTSAECKVMELEEIWKDLKSAHICMKEFELLPGTELRESQTRVFADDSPSGGCIR